MKYASLRDNPVACACIASMKGSFCILFDLNISTHLLVAAVFSMCHSPSILYSFTKIRFPIQKFGTDRFDVNRH